MRITKTTSAVLLVLFALIFASCNSSTSSKEEGNKTAKKTSSKEESKRYPFEKAIIHQKISAMGIESTPIVYVDKWGLWETVETNNVIKVAGTTIENRTLKITKGDDNWDIDLAAQTGTHFKKQPSLSALGVDAEKLSEEMMGKLHMKYLGTETFLGYECKKYSVQSDKETSFEYLMYGNLMMKMSGEAMGIPTSIEVTKIETIAPPTEKFEVPSNINITEIKM